MKTRKISKGWLLSPIIIATIISLLTMTFHWTDLNMGFQLTPSMLRYMRQPASVRLDYTQLPEALILQGNVDLRIESGEEFAIWVSPFIAYFAEIRQTDRSLTIRTSHAPANRNLTEMIRITLPTDNLMPSDITITGNSQFSLKISRSNTSTLRLSASKSEQLRTLRCNILPYPRWVY